MVQDFLCTVGLIDAYVRSFGRSPCLIGRAFGTQAEVGNAIRNDHCTSDCTTCTIWLRRRRKALHLASALSMALSPGLRLGVSHGVRLLHCSVALDTFKPLRRHLYIHVRPIKLAAVSCAGRLLGGQINEQADQTQVFDRGKAHVYINSKHCCHFSVRAIPILENIVNCCRKLGRVYSKSNVATRHGMQLQSDALG